MTPSFRHTAFDGAQVVIHNRLDEYQEIFATNLYPGPSAKKGIYSCLLHQGEKEGWVTNHCSAVLVETPYDNIVTFMHEGASGGGKSEMIEHILGVYSVFDSLNRISGIPEAVLLAMANWASDSWPAYPRTMFRPREDGVAYFNAQ